MLCFTHGLYWKYQTLCARRPSRSCQGIRQNTQRSFTSGHLVLPTTSAFLCDLAASVAQVCPEDGPHRGLRQGITKACQKLQECEAFPKTFGGGKSSISSWSPWRCSSEKGSTLSQLFMFPLIINKLAEFGKCFEKNVKNLNFVLLIDANFFKPNFHSWPTSANKCYYLHCDNTNHFHSEIHFTHV